MENKRCTVAILNYNGLRWLQAFLPGVEAHSPEAIVYVYDNASTDGSQDYLRQHHPNVLLVAGTENLGFCAGYNAAFRHITTPYAVLLNSDVEVTEGWLTPLLQELEENPDVGAVQPKIRSYHHRHLFEYAGAAGGYIDRFGYPYCRGRIFDTVEEDLGQYDTPADVFWATGACMAVRTELFKQLGGLDERFFAHMEEIDWCWRAQRAGYRIRVQPGSVVYHVGGGTLAYDSPRKLRLNYRNNLLMLDNNLAGIPHAGTLFGRLVLDGISALHLLLKSQWKAPFTIFMAHMDFYRLRSSKIRHPLPKHIRLGSRSIIWAYFIQGRKKFSDL